MSICQLTQKDTYLKTIKSNYTHTNTYTHTHQNQVKDNESSTKGIPSRYEELPADSLLRKVTDAEWKKELERMHGGRVHKVCVVKDPKASIKHQMGPCPDDNGLIAGLPNDSWRSRSEDPDYQTPTLAVGLKRCV